MPTPEVKGFKDRNTGTTYALNDETARAEAAKAVLFAEAQELTTEQKAQARTNIGAGVPVTVDATLATAGAAADAKATGDALAEKLTASDIDDTLATTGKAADAKAAGDAINAADADAKDALYDTAPPITVINGLYTGTVGEQYGYIVSNSWYGVRFENSGANTWKVTYSTASDNAERAHIILCAADGTVLSVIKGKYNARHYETVYVQCEATVAFVLVSGYVNSVFNGVYVQVYGAGKSENEAPLRRGEIVLPPVIYVAAGRQAFLYWSSIANATEGDKGIYFEVGADIGMNTERGYLIDAKAADIGTHTLTIIARDSYTREQLSSYTGSVVVVAANAGSGEKNILMIGDSRTLLTVNGTQGETYASSNDETITATLKGLLEDSEGTAFTFVGTQVSAADGTVKNLSTSGWKYTDVSSYLTAAGGIVDYIEDDCGLGAGASLDYVTIMLGVNDVSLWNSNDADVYASNIKRIIPAIDSAKTLVNSVHAAYPDCRVVMILEPTTCASQDGFGFGVAGNTARNAHMDFESVLKCYRKYLIETFSAAEYADYVTLCSAGLWCDRLYGFPYTMEKAGDRISVMELPRFCNSVHPHDDGLKQIADGIFSTIKYLES